MTLIVLMEVLRAWVEAVEEVVQVERLVETEVSLKIGNMKKKKQWIFIMLVMFAYGYIMGPIVFAA